MTSPTKAAAGRFAAVAALLWAAWAPAYAADPATLYGKWIEKFVNGNGMVTEFTAATLSYYPVDAFSVHVKDAQHIELDDGGAGLYRLVRLPP